MMIKKKKNIKFRHELKYIISKTDDYVLTQRLNRVFKHDNNSGINNTYVVNSLYFDTPYDRALKQKINGVNSREKFRLRYYNNDTSFIKLEKKFKRNNLCKKYNTRISKDEVENILQGDIEFLLNSEEPLFNELYSKMKGTLLFPKTIVTYEREAFIFIPGNVRITIDRNINTSLNNTEFLNLDNTKINVLNEYSILEVKYDSFLPDIVKQAIQIPNVTLTAFSKYAISRKYD